MKRAFTLIELLVVIAIIAILAAILFPVFAQAKMAAKKTTAVSNVKQLALSIALYEADSDDLYPRAFGYIAVRGAGHMTNYVHDVPSDWRPDAQSSRYQEFAKGGWVNNTEMYRKNTALLNPGETTEVNYFDDDFSEALKTPTTVNFQFNGLLHTYPASAVASPSQLMILGQFRGKEAMKGYSIASPALQCTTWNAPCIYQPSSASCSTSVNGQTSTYVLPSLAPSMWIYGRGMVVAMADGSAKYQRAGMNVRGMTDFRTDLFTDYDETGAPHSHWMDENFCHPLLLRPDFDFQNYGSPISFSWDE